MLSTEQQREEPMNFQYFPDSSGDPEEDRFYMMSSMETAAREAAGTCTACIEATEPPFSFALWMFEQWTRFQGLLCRLFAV
jgi:hypothetical protein